MRPLGHSETSIEVVCCGRVSLPLEEHLDGLCHNVSQQGFTGEQNTPSTTVFVDDSATHLKTRPSVLGGHAGRCPQPGSGGLHRTVASAKEAGFARVSRPREAPSAPRRLPHPRVGTAPERKIAHIENLASSIVEVK